MQSQRPGLPVKGSEAILLPSCSSSQETGLHHLHFNHSPLKEREHHQIYYHGNGVPWRCVVFAGVNPGVPARLEYVNHRLHADIKLGHPHDLQLTLWILLKVHVSARLQRNTYVREKKRLNDFHGGDTRGIQ